MTAFTNTSANRGTLQISYEREKRKLKLKMTIYCSLPKSKYTAVAQGARRKLGLFKKRTKEIIVVM